MPPNFLKGDWRKLRWYKRKFFLVRGSVWLISYGCLQVWGYVVDFLLFVFFSLLYFLFTSPYLSFPVFHLFPLLLSSFFFSIYTYINMPPQIKNSGGKIFPSWLSGERRPSSGHQGKLHKNSSTNGKMTFPNIFDLHGNVNTTHHFQHFNTYHWSTRIWTSSQIQVSWRLSVTNLYVGCIYLPQKITCTISYNI